MLRVKRKKIVDEEDDNDDNIYNKITMKTMMITYKSLKNITYVCISIRSYN